MSEFSKLESPVQEMLILMRDMCDILRQREKHGNPPDNSLSNGQEAQEGEGGNSAAYTSFKPKRFGMNREHAQRTNAVVANYDYRLKYPQDRRYHELDSEARIWWVYLDEATAFDNDMVGELGDSLDILLIFAGLFSAVITTFVAQTSQSLSTNYSLVSSSYLGEITAILRAGVNGTAVSQVPATDTSFVPATDDLWVNGLWFTSLTITLSVALFAVLAKQWLRQYMSIITGTPRERAFIRQFRFDGLQTWRVQAIIGVLPVLLHISLVLFLIGLVIFLVSLSISIAYVAGAITVAVIVLYLASNALPLFVAQCSYRTTFSHILYYFCQLPRVAYQRFSSCLPQKTHSKGQPEPLHSLKEIERNAACDRPVEDQNNEFKALSWLGEYTSSISAKEIILRSLGAFTSKMSPKLSTDKALRILYGFETYEELVRHVWFKLEEYGDQWESIFRSLIHLTDLPPEKSQITVNGDIIGQVITTSDVESALALFASNTPFFALEFAGNTIIDSHSGLAWLVDNYFRSDPPIPAVMVPPLVWRGFFKASFNNKIPEALVPYLSGEKAMVDTPYALNCPVSALTLITLNDQVDHDNISILSIRSTSPNPNPPTQNSSRGIQIKRYFRLITGIVTGRPLVDSEDNVDVELSDYSPTDSFRV
ncbi:hypothetical protein DFH05DRAFT_1463529 [Lentinula detonsa]|uniref:DUF6535 domain-containing protein n=1 Tax=Lentinula detonsa TaxID=2804962 RepID=A0A9W8NSC6_9AGAR|nr:hypothetical protein DFH05DRAFT_1463529 [Lentinula detonsa]